MSKQISKKSESKSKTLNSHGVILVLSAPSGAGKSTVAEKILAQTSRIQRVVTHTTRQPRPGEVQGDHYHFVSKEEFEAMLSRDAFVEHAKVYDNYYGTSVAEIERILNLKKDILLVIESKGAAVIAEKFDRALFILMLPPSLDELSRRIFNRPGSETNQGEVNQRLSLAKKEVGSMTWYDYVVVNEHVEDTAVEILQILAVEKKRLKYSGELLEPFLKPS